MYRRVMGRVRVRVRVRVRLRTMVTVVGVPFVSGKC